MEPSLHPLPVGKGSVIPGGCRSPLPSEEARVGEQKKKRATILTFAAIPRQFLKPAPTSAAPVLLPQRSMPHPTVGADFKPALR